MMSGLVDLLLDDNYLILILISLNNLPLIQFPSIIEYSIKVASETHLQILQSSLLVQEPSSGLHLQLLVSILYDFRALLHQDFLLSLVVGLFGT